MMYKIKENIPFLFFAFLFILGFGILLYPVVSDAINQISFRDVISTYEQSVSDENHTLYETMIQDAIAYNEKLTTSSIADVFSDPEIIHSDDYMEILNLNHDGVMGYLSIPKINVKIPIYHGTSSDILSKGVGHLEGSSFPVGGESTHAILSAHRGLPSARLFTDLDQLEVGDQFYIYILDQVFTYQVDQVLVIEPSDTTPLQIQEGKDLVTLVTCTPYGVNTHRLLVRGQRVKDTVDSSENVDSTQCIIANDWLLYGGICIVIILFIITLFFIYKKHKKKRFNRDKI